VEIFRPVHVIARFEDGANESLAQKAFDRILKGKPAPPTDAMEDSTQPSPFLPSQAEQVVASVGRRSEHSVAGTQLAEGLEENLRSPCGRIGADDDGNAVTTKKPLEGAFQSLAEALATLLHEAVSGKGRGKRPPAEEKIAGNAFLESVHLSDGVGNEGGVKIRRPTRAKKRDQASLDSARRNAPSKDGHRRERLPTG
jgi:hypothetical protein